MFVGVDLQVFDGIQGQGAAEEQAVVGAVVNIEFD